MAHEREIKFKVDDFGPIRRKLRACGAKYLGTAIQTDSFFDTAGRRLRQADQGFRVRRYLLDLAVALDAAAAVQMIRALGMKEQMTIQKRRASYKLGRTLVELDELPLIGCFVEIEGPTEKAILAAAGKLKLQTEPVTEAYSHMLSAECKRLRRSDRSIKF